MEILILTVLRLLAPLLILRWPIFGIISSMYLDFQDFNYFNIQNDNDMKNYQAWDKILDTYYLALAFYTSLSWKETLAKKLSIFFFSYRAIGIAVFLAVQSRLMLLAFPNLFEHFFLFYLLFKKFTNNAKLFTSLPISIIVIISIAIPKLFAEYYVHVLHSPPLLNLDRTVITPLFPATQEGIALYILYIGPAVAILIARILYARRAGS